MLTFTEYFNQQATIEPTEGQKNFFRFFDAFLLSVKPRCALLLRGYAGTGKTTLIGFVVRYLEYLEKHYILLAPTGRAAKVMSSYSGRQAFTIHKLIYQRKAAAEGTVFVELKQNQFTDALFIVDEASMIQAEHDTGGYTIHGSLLEDLVQFVYSGVGCRLMLSGDVAQLPPVGSDLSLALELGWMQENFRLTAGMVELHEVVRQAVDSGILTYATELRKFIESGQQGFRFGSDFPDVKAINGLEMQEMFETAMDKWGRDQVIVITRSNKRANVYNQQVRSRLLWMEEELCTGDYLMVVKNNYHWLRADLNGGFIANGDFAEVVRIRGIEEEYGFRFANTVLRLTDEDVEVEAKIFLDSLTSEGPAMPGQAIEALFEELKIVYAGEKSRRALYERIRNDDHYNALQVKFAYAVTCHKSQGGQWPVVFIDHGYLTEEMVNKELYRWLYTALTRATKQVYLVNFDPQFLPVTE